MVDQVDEILYIDDEKENLSGFKFVFKKSYKIHLASSGIEGIEIIKNNNIKVVIADQRMPNMTGVEFFEIIANEFPHIYRIILTGYTDVQDIIQAINKGKIYQYIRKPWDKEEVKIIIDNAINAHNLKENNRNLFNDLQLVNIELEEANHSLEEKVKERTKEIELKNIELEKHRNHLEELVKQRTADLEEAKNKAEESDKLKSAFLANVSHEIRTPMNAIIGFTDLLLNFDYSEQEKNDFKDHVISNTNTLLRLIDDILDISKIEANQVNIEYEEHDLIHILSDLFSIFNKQKLDKYKSNIEIIFEKAENISECIIKTDIVRLNQILTNLLSNALKFTEEGTITYGFKFVDHDKNLLFHVKDTGIGIPKNKFNIIFDRFRKVNQTNIKLYRGAGLGLFISKRLVELFNGTMWVESIYGKGSTFYFKIPYLPGSKDNLNKESLHIESDVKKSLKGKYILVAEDEDSSYTFIEKALQDTEVELIRAKNGQQTLNLFKAAKNIDLVLMDMQMPIMDGYEATQLIKQLNKSIPVIAQTAYAMYDQRSKIINAGCDDLIAKPYKQQELINTILKYIC